MDQRGAQPVEEQLAIGQSGQIVVDRIVQDALLRGLDFGDVGKRADDAHHFALGVDDRPRFQDEAVISAVRAAQADVVIDAAGPLLEDALERRRIAVAVERVKNVEPSGGRPFERAASQAELAFDLGADVDLVRADVPVENRIAASGHRQRAALGVGAAGANAARSPRTRFA